VPGVEEEAALSLLPDGSMGSSGGTNTRQRLVSGDGLGTYKHQRKGWV
jgi:hypothetical protein